MNLDPHVPLKDQNERQSLLSEVINAEKQLWALIHSKDLSHAGVEELYLKVRSGYEKIILNDHERINPQDTEYSLWKLHYKYIDEFRKKIRQTSAYAESGKSAISQNVVNVQNSIESHKQQFISFLSDSIQFYHNLIKRVRRCYALPEDLSFYENCAVDTTKLHKCQYSCQRFLVCLGDLARYRELYMKPDFQRCNWSVAATYYFRASLVWPDSGNPQNQLALLATYIGDDFLALYHCIRSLAIKEPFPDSWNNLILLFEKNRSSHLCSLSKEVHFNFLNPYERCTSLTLSQSSCGSQKNDIPQSTERLSSAKSDLWPLFVRLISFFFIESSLDEFSCTLASTIRELDVLLALDDTELKAALEPYQNMESGRTGPFRALQMASILIFIIHNLTESWEHKELKEESNMQEPMLIQLALTTAFVCLARFVERCLNSKPLELSPLLPAVLVFVEWLVNLLNKVETYGVHENARSAMSYFFHAFVDLLNELHKNEVEVETQDNTALWEDYELRGFTPIALVHSSLDFISHPILPDNIDSTNSCCAHRIFRSAMHIVDKSSNSQKWIFYDKLGRKFYTAELKSSPCQGVAELAESKTDPEVKQSPRQREAEMAESSLDIELKEPHQHGCETAKETREDNPGGNQSRPIENVKSVVEEEEVILFKPIMRYNSAPLPVEIFTDEEKEKTASSDECLRRTTSLFTAQSQAQIDSFSFGSDTSNLRSSNTNKEQEPLLKDATTYPAGPPSLNAWVPDRESLNIEGEKATRTFYKRSLSPIDEMVSDPFTGLSIRVTEDSIIGSRHGAAAAPYSPPPYAVPVPSAPLLPDDAIWFTDNVPHIPEYKTARNIKETGGVLGVPPPGGYTNWSPTHGPLGFSPSIPGLNEVYQPVVGMSSSEWLHQYRNLNPDRASSQVWPVHFYAAPGTLGNFYAHDTPSFDLRDQWGNPLSSSQMVYLESPQLHPAGSPLIYSADEQVREKLFTGNPKPSPYGYGYGVMGDRPN
ncbi:nonsense-mediated mRNA decay factor SMG7-like [Diospyros lotus]|uniref:nonsense-mediated mRNA decay factor SMG7-like n=1 Tax=Diospyros lotus TaxID=55363 RepID=UPI00225A2BBC|nr:nonsense-mediated mRNA decay factor SMG7-like [Diospyros lotus]